VGRAESYDSWLELNVRREVEERLAVHADDVARRREELIESNLRNAERASRLSADLLDRYEKLLGSLPLVRSTLIRPAQGGQPAVYEVSPSTPNPVLDALRLHRISSHGEPPRSDGLPAGSPGGADGRDDRDLDMEFVESEVQARRLRDPDLAARCVQNARPQATGPSWRRA
jgi:hypothetical protein